MGNNYDYGMRCSLFDPTHTFNDQSILRFMKERGEQSVCRFIGVEPDRPKTKSKLGIALSTIGKTPINGFRHPKSDGTNGWYIWCGEEFSIEEGFFLLFILSMLQNIYQEYLSI